MMQYHDSVKKISDRITKEKLMNRWFSIMEIYSFYCTLFEILYKYYYLDYNNKNEIIKQSNRSKLYDREISSALL